MSSSEILGPYDIGGSKRPRNEIENETDFASLDLIKEKKHKKDKKDKKEKKSSKEKKSKHDNKEEEENPNEDNEDNQEAELPLAERLALISKQITEVDEAPTESVQHDEEENKHKKDHKIKSKSKSKSSATTEISIPTADSLVTLLDQAIQSGDGTLLEQCLGCSNTEIIDATVKKLPTQRILVLLKTLVGKFERRPSRGILITHWISSILKYHFSYLITLPDLSSQLASLSQILEQRIHSYTKLTSLAGRLDLLMSQVVHQQPMNAIEPEITFEF
jgi:hypothetical protein